MTVPDFMPVLSYGSHKSPKDGACIMEYCSILAGERFSDMPSCVHPLLRGISIAVNDYLSDESRYKIIPYISRLMNTYDVELTDNDLVLLQWSYDNAFATIYSTIEKCKIDKDCSDVLVEILETFVSQFERITNHTPINITDNDYRMLKDAVGV